ncbi:MAG: hypothetical protein ACM3O3_13120 [Syntrophothermus sp.]
MFKYTIVKKGRKWFQAVTNDSNKYKAQIEINELSKNWVTGDNVEFNGVLDKQESFGHIKFFVYPKTPEQIKESEEKLKYEKEQKEINKWFKYVEGQTQYVYANGVSKLRNMKLSDEQKQRLDSLIAERQANYLKSKINDYFGYIEKNINEYWYVKGENCINEWIEELNKMGVDTVKYQEKLKTLKDSFIKKETVKQVKRERDCFIISDISYGKNDRYEIGTLVRHNSGRIGKIIKTSKYYQEDAMSFGYMVDECWVKHAECDCSLVTDSEREQFEQKEKEAQERKDKEKELSNKKSNLKKETMKLFKYVFENGVFEVADEENFEKHLSPRKYLEAHGENFYDTCDIYGGGEKILLDNDKIWAIRNNGADGDNWGYNNLPGMIGKYKEYDEFINEQIELIKKLRIELGVTQ